MKISVMSRISAEEYSMQKHDEASVVISINGVYDTIAQIVKTEQNNIRDILFLRFDDTDTGALAINKLDTLKIKNFVNKHKSMSNMIVHCGAGQSRSAGVAAAILKYLYNDDTQIFNNRRYTPNMKCYRAVLETFMEDTFDFHDAWVFLNEHFIFNGFFQDCLDIDICKVDPNTGEIDFETDENNTKTEVWLECGPWAPDCKTHNDDLDCGGDTFEEAIINLAYLVREQYGE